MLYWFGNLLHSIETTTEYRFQIFPGLSKSHVNWSLCLLSRGVPGEFLPCIMKPLSGWRSWWFTRLWYTDRFPSGPNKKSSEPTQNRKCSGANKHRLCGLQIPWEPQCHLEIASQQCQHNIPELQCSFPAPVGSHFHIFLVFTRQSWKHLFCQVLCPVSFMTRQVVSSPLFTAWQLCLRVSVYCLGGI